MDPDVCYQEMLAAMEEVDRLLVVARERAEALHEWLGAGGVGPAQASPEIVRVHYCSVKSWGSIPHRCRKRDLVTISIFEH